MITSKEDQALSFDNFELIKENFPNAEQVLEENSLEKIRVNSIDIVNLLTFLKNSPEFDFNMLNTLIAVDLNDQFELIYDLYSTNTNRTLVISLLVDRDSHKAPSITEVFKSAHFDECEIFDLFGIEFSGNKNLKRLFMPKNWIGHPLRKDYVFEDERLAWNSEVKS